MLFLWGEEIFALVFGDNWSEAGAMAAYLVPGLYSFMIFDQSLNIFVIMNEQYTKFVWEVFRFALLGLVVVAGYFFELEAMTLILYLSIAQTTAYCVVFLLCVRIIQRSRDSQEQGVRV
jgi:O-antigen/teichoic acid export membrane protein